MRALFVITALILSSPVVAQDVISAERPSFSSSPLALGAGLWQIEGGYQYTRIDSNVDAQVLPLLLLRYGAGERTEVQLAWSGYNRLDVGPASIDGFGDMSVGVKWQLADDNATTPIGLFAAITLPVGDDELSSNEVDPAVGLFWAHDGRLSLFGTVQLSETDNDTTLSNAVGINLPMAELCLNCSGFVEYVGAFPDGSGPQHILNGGVSWLRSNNLVFDVYLGLGLNDRAGDGFLGFGAAYRF